MKSIVTWALIRTSGRHDICTKAVPREFTANGVLRTNTPHASFIITSWGAFLRVAARTLKDRSFSALFFSTAPIRTTAGRTATLNSIAQGSKGLR
jgi:hypothetical protein